MCLNRISQIKDTNNQLIARYDYDIWDNRIAKTTYKDGQATTTYYFYNQDGLLAETNAQGLVMTQYGFAPSDSWQTSPLFIKTDKGYAYYHNDQLGTPRLATDKNGNVVWQADYATNGEATLSSNNQITSNLRFPGQYFDAESNLHYNTRRYYDPKIGRYITQDPIGFDGGLNLYNYVGGDPINNADPTGEILPAIAMGYARCVAACKVIQFASNKLGYCDDGNCFSDCLNPLNWVGGGRGAKIAKRVNMRSAEEARDAMANERKRRHATYVGGEKDGRTAAGCSGGGRCAEDDIADQLGSDANMTGAKGWRRNKETGNVEYTDIPVCIRCQSKYHKSQFPDDVKFDPDGAWSK